MGKYDQLWQKYRRLRLLYRTGYWGFLPLLVVLEMLHMTYRISVPVQVVQLLIVLIALVAFRLYFFRCPRCQRFYAIAQRYSPKLFTRECLHCGLKKFTDGENN